MRTHLSLAGGMCRHRRDIVAPARFFSLKLQCRDDGITGPLWLLKAFEIRFASQHVCLCMNLFADALHRFGKAQRMFASLWTVRCAANINFLGQSRTHNAITSFAKMHFFPHRPLLSFSLPIFEILSLENCGWKRIGPSDARKSAYFEQGWYFRVRDENF